MLYLFVIKYTDNDFETVDKNILYDMEYSRGLIRSIDYGSEHTEYQITVFKELTYLDWVNQDAE